MTTNTASAPAAIPFSAVEAARKEAGRKAAEARRAAGTGQGAGAKAAATRRARLAAQAEATARLEAQAAERLANLPTLRAKACIERARKFDEAEAARQQRNATLARLAGMKRAVAAVNALGLRQPGTRGRKALMVTADNFESILARAERRGFVA